MIKYIKSFALFSLLVFFPLLSWYYLDSGLEYRKGLMEDIAFTGMQVDQLYGDSPLLDSLLERKTTIYLTKHKQLGREEIIKLYEQFEKTYTFQMITERDEFSDLYSDNFMAAVDYIKPTKGDVYALLIDTTGNVRYQYQSTDDIKRLVEHTAITIPRKPAKDIVLKNYKDGE